MQYPEHISVERPSQTWGRLVSAKSSSSEECDLLSFSPGSESKAEIGKRYLTGLLGEIAGSSMSPSRITYRINPFDGVLIDCSQLIHSS
jgi:hypothetical protein